MRTRLIPALAGLLLTTLSATLSADGQGAETGVFEGHGDIGAVAHAGSVTFDAASGVFRVTGGGENMWGAEDAFHFVWKRASGDLMIAADVAFEGQGGHPHRKAGVMIRQSLEPDAPYADLVVHGDGLTSLQYRDRPGGETRQIIAAVKAPSRIRLEKEGAYLYMSVAGADGRLAPGGGNYRLPFAEPFYVGLAVCAHDNAVTETARFSNVEILPLSLAPVTETGYPAAVDSTLEILEVASGNRTVVYTSDGKIEAPNWSRDGKDLLFNAGGRIWTLPVTGGTPREINTGPLRANNNDHGLSPDGSLLIVSDQSQADDISRIYVLPAAGSDDPQLVVGHPSGRSYWHAWSPDGAVIAYTAQRPEVSPAYDIWAKRLDGGEEWRLVASTALDDGADYSPDGHWLYFNSSRSGAMQIWRTRADGTDPQRVTFDESFRDWFPHPSPDGRWIVMVSFGLDIDLNDHPPNRDVAIRMMPADGSAAPVEVTRLFGGQGTMNVPSWSPDSTRVAFVSYRLDRADRP